MSSMLVAGNWKMNGSVAALREFGVALADVRLGCDAVLCVPFTLLAAAQDLFGAGGMRWGAQDCGSAAGGAFSGDVSAAMVREFQATHVIVGHSERRALHGETDAQVAEKARRVVDAGMTPIVCVGETADERDLNQTRKALRRQLLPVLRTLGGEARHLVVAYEPIWAIGTGRAASPGMVEEAHGFLRDIVLFNASPGTRVVRILYGGSVSVLNAHVLMSCDAVDGVLVGGASLKPKEFLSICDSASMAAQARELLTAGMRAAAARPGAQAS
jgi:triosephosphate isomerase